MAQEKKAAHEANMETAEPEEIDAMRHQRTFMQYRRMILKFGVTFPMATLSGCLPHPSQNTLSKKQAFRNVFEFESVACRNLPPEACDFLNGGADDLQTLKANRTGFDHIQLVPRTLVDVSSTSTDLELFGSTLKSPLLLAPIGLNSLFHPDGELAVARAAARTGHKMIASTMTSYSFPEITKASGSPIWFQLYFTTDKEFNRDLIAAVESTGCSAMFVTVDSPTAGNREGHASFLASLAKSGQLVFGNFKAGMKQTVNPSLTWKELEWIKSITKMRVVPKGIVAPEDAHTAIASGMDGIMVSNHGGRQLETNRGTIESLPEIVEIVDNRIPILLDGGIRRGTDILKALALGATAVATGRPFVWGLATGGEQGVEQVLQLLQTELVRDMQLLGVRNLKGLNKDFVR